MERLTLSQRLAIERASPDNSYCFKADGRTMKSLCRRFLAVETSGFGCRHGGICELTERGKQVRKELEEQGFIQEARDG